MELTEKKALELLKRYSSKSFRKILAHSKAVQKVALRIAGKIPEADSEFIKIASLLHDIGRFRCPPGKNSIRHGIIGAKILRKEGLERYARVAERHLGVGITKEDIKRQKLDLPLKDYVPISKEEKIIAHADNLVFGEKIGNLKMVIERFRKELGEEYAGRIKKLDKEIKAMKK